MSNKEVTQLIREAVNQGWTVTKTKGEHFKWVSPLGVVVFSSQTPSDRRAIMNLKQDLKKRGFIEIEKKKRRK
jgi:hypothetical protein